jgi:hypothetical protein
MPWLPLPETCFLPCNWYLLGRIQPVILGSERASAAGAFAEATPENAHSHQRQRLITALGRALPKKNARLRLMAMHMTARMAATRMYHRGMTVVVGDGPWP